MTPGLGLDTARVDRGFEVMPAGSAVTLFMRIRPGNTGIEGLCTRSAKGDCEGLNCEYTVVGGEFDGRKLFGFHVLDGVTAGHAKAGEISRGLLRAIYEGAHGLDPKDQSPAARARLADATLASFNGLTFVAELGIERGGAKADGSGNWPDKNVIAWVPRLGDKDYRKLNQSPPIPIDRGAAASPHGAPATAPAAIAKPSWAT